MKIEFKIPRWKVAVSSKDSIRFYELNALTESTAIRQVKKSYIIDDSLNSYYKFYAMRMESTDVIQIPVEPTAKDNVPSNIPEWAIPLFNQG